MGEVLTDDMFFSKDKKFDIEDIEEGVRGTFFHFKGIRYAMKFNWWRGRLRYDTWYFDTVEELKDWVRESATLEESESIFKNKKTD